MPTMTIKEWVAEYRRANEWEEQERLSHLPHETIEDSVRAYFALCQMLLPFAVAAEGNAGLSELRQRHYISLVEKWTRLARRQHHAAQP